MTPVEMCYLGWQESLAMLARIVEPDVPDGAWPNAPSLQRASDER